MATFLTPLDGVNAALHMLREIDDFNALRGSPDLVLKIGLHHGAAIAVTLNDRLDYFGQTVNIAARVQGLADEDEIYITKEIFDSEGVKGALKDFEVLAEQSMLKGISEAVSVYKVRV
jgi:class 3 adenylate cyclase